MGKQIAQRHDTERLWKFFAEFCIWDKAAGGPDPHMKVAGWMVKDEIWQHRMWMAGCYMGTYVVPSAEVIYQAWEPEDIDARSDLLEDWLTKNWDGIVLRRERRAVNTPRKLATYLASYAEWLLGLDRKDPEDWLVKGSFPPGIAYEEAWVDIQKVWGLGRYIAIKGLEFMSRYCGTDSEIPDIRANGGWSPRKALSFLYPEHALALNGGNDLASVELAENLGFVTQGWMAKRGISLSMYEVQTLLCDWKQSYFGQRQYPGRSQDSEYAHAQKVFSHFKEFPTRLWEAREELFAPEVLAEKNDWDGVREELGECQSIYGYTWNDFQLDYSSTDDLMVPVRK